MSGGVYGATTGATSLLNKRVQIIPWWYSPYSTKISKEWPANCSAPVPAKDCERNCVNFRCGMTQSPVFFGDTHGLDWLAGAGTGALSKEIVPGWPIGSTNQAEWAATEKLGDKHALGIMTTQWHGGGEAPDVTGLSPTADFGWNRRHMRRTSGCATAMLKSDDIALDHSEFHVVSSTAASEKDLVDRAVNSIVLHSPRHLQKPLAAEFKTDDDDHGDGFGNNVLDHGAGGRNSSDDTAAFQKLLLHGGLVLVPTGLYQVTRTLQMWRAPSDSGVTLAGASVGSTKLLWGGNSSAVIWASSSGSGHVTIRDLSLFPLDVARARRMGQRPGQHGIELGPVQTVVNIQRVEIFMMGGDGIHHRGNSAIVNVRSSDLHSNWGWGVHATSESGGPAQNLVVVGNSIYANRQGGVSIESSYGCSVRDNDIEGPVAPAQPLLLLTGNQVYISGNTLGLSKSAINGTAALFAGSNIVSSGGSFTINAANQTALAIVCRDNTGQHCPTGVLVQGAVFAAPGGDAAGVGLHIEAGVRQATVVAPVFANGFATDVVDEGLNSTFLPPLNL